MTDAHGKSQGTMPRMHSDPIGTVRVVCMQCARERLLGRAAAGFCGSEDEPDLEPFQVYGGTGAAALWVACQVVAMHTRYHAGDHVAHVVAFAAVEFAA